MEITMAEYESSLGIDELIHNDCFDIYRVLQEYEDYPKKWLEPTYGQKSFWKKAAVYKLGDGIQVLKSYSTVVMVKINGWYYKIWDDWSATTMLHINSFIDTYGGFRLNKRMWNGLKTYEPFHFRTDGETVEYKYAEDDELPFY